jgi:hypothetical protein
MCMIVKRWLRPKITIVLLIGVFSLLLTNIATGKQVENTGTVTIDLTGNAVSVNDYSERHACWDGCFTALISAMMSSSVMSSTGGWA